MILISGWAHSAAGLEPLATALNPHRKCSGIILNLNELVMPDPAAALAEIIASAPQPVNLIGWSTGAMLALETTLRTPQAVSRLVLISGCARFCNDTDYQCGIPETALKIMRRGLQRNPEATLNAFFADSASPEQVSARHLELLVDAALRTGLENLHRGLEYLLRFDIRYKLDSLPPLPVLLVHGSEDRIIPCTAAAFLARELKNCRFEAVNGAGHDLPLRNPAQTAALIAEFIYDGT